MTGLYAALGLALVAVGALVAWLAMNRRNARLRASEAHQRRRVAAMREKQGVKADVETQDDTRLIDAISR
jgi:hypothetical protein